MAALTVPGSMLTGFSPVCRSLGLDPEALLGKFDLSVEAEGVLQARLEATRVVALLEEAAVLGDEPALGLRIGGHWQFEQMGPVALLLLEARSCGDFLLRVQRYANALNQTLRYQLSGGQGGEVRVALMLQGAEVGHSLQLVELMIARTLAVLRSILATEWAPSAVMFQHGPRYPEARYQELLKARVIFNGDLDGLLLTEADLQRPLQFSRDEVQTSVTQFLDQQLLPGHEQLAEQIKRLLMGLYGAGQPVGLEQIAQLLNLPPRTLQYQLKAAGLSFRGLLAQVQAQIARNLLIERRLSVAEVAEFLGFSETSAFSRAFKKWHGVSPSQAWRLRPEQPSSAGAQGG